MERTRKSINKIPDAILTSDWHLREDQPLCRTDNYWEAQWKKVDFVSDLQKQYGCPIWHAGDLYDFWKPSPMLLSETSKRLPNNFITVLGNHDLPQHNLELAYKSGVYNLMINGRLSILQNGHWNQSLGDGRTGFIIKGKQATLQHIMTYQGKLPWPGCSSPLAAGLLRKYKQFSLICTGDNHKPFTEEFEGRWLVNPGSLMRMDADQINHRPRVYLWFAETNEIQAVYIPIQDNIISREHITSKKERDSRIEAFVSKLDNNWKAKMSFEENLEEFSKVNGIREPVMNIIYKSLENEKTNH